MLGSLVSLHSPPFLLLIFLFLLLFLGRFFLLVLFVPYARVCEVMFGRRGGLDSLDDIPCHEDNCVEDLESENESSIDSSKPTMTNLTIVFE